MFPNFATLETRYEDKATVDARVDCIDMLPVPMRYRKAYDIRYSVGFLRCLSLSSRQCEGLETWDKREVQFPRFFILCLCLIYEVKMGLTLGN